MKATVAYHLCPLCFRATPTAAHERFCPNDGTPLLSVCPNCGVPITSPYARHCTACGKGLGLSEDLERK